MRRSSRLVLQTLSVVVALIAATGMCADARGTAPRLRFEPEHGLFSKPISVTVVSPVPGVAIHCSTNGGLPSPEAAAPYTKPLVVATTTVLRCAAFKDGVQVGIVDTHSFIFPADVLVQTGAGFPATWGTNNNAPVPADYEMDPEIVRHPACRDALEPALRALPSLSIVMERDDLFGAARGIYANPRQSGADWERPASVEWIQPAGQPGFQIDCGIRIQGGWNRRPEESPKHAFRLAFRKKHGAGKLKFPLFEQGDGAEFNGLILRAGCNNSWLHWHPAERERGDYLRDQWMRESHAALGHPAARGRFVHLYLNGLYWGIYNLTERPDEDFAADHFGGKPIDYDARNGANILSGDEAAWQRLFAIANAGVTNAAALQAIAELLDVPAFIDYMILNLYAANGDWDRHSNWYAARRRDPPGKFHFFAWDGERSIERVEDNTLATDDDQSPTRLFQRLRANAEFRRQFAERARRHLTGEGDLTPQAGAARFKALSDRLDAAMVAESARWGDYRRDAHSYKVGPYTLYTRDDHWRPEIQRLLKDYFPRRSAVVLQQFQDAGF